ncbi:porin [Burkholderia gladioli]|uniref:porin n=1 Tax=Burkholderia gladioli TaxID=28095 RepID=UPI001640BFDB|nr:porin [Burkholderia gladioli]
MKKTLPAIAALLALSGVAHAQNSVTLYGLIDTGFAFNSNAKGGRQYSASSGNLQGDRWGLRGIEDLGGGYAAIFRLEGGYSVNSGALGQGGALFGRKAYVGLQTPYGTVTLGRQYDALGDYVGDFEAANFEKFVPGTEWGSIYGAHPGDMDNLDNSYRINNTVKYASRSYYGLKFGGMYSLGGQAGDVTRNQVWGLGVGYDHGPFAGGIAIERAKNPNFGVFGTNPNANSATAADAANVSNPVFSGFASAGAWQVISAGAAYHLGNATIGGVYSNVAFQNLGATAGAGLNPLHLSGTAKFNIGELSVSYLLTPSLQLGTAYTYTKGSSVGSVSGATYNQVNLGADYFLSRRTDLYVVGIYQHASGVDSTGKKAVAAIANLSNSSSDRQAALVFGIRHKF